MGGCRHPPSPALPSILFAAVAMCALVMSKSVRLGDVYLEGRLVDVDRIEMAQGAFPSKYQKQFLYIRGRIYM